ncbi:helix-turn-helix domain-containing protein [Microbacterium sp. P05]|uniref:helix-turn-helix domain-containing protein n=1 Tax=Microbacterium sp. P05 TaxID=3366948 RepID=UPI003746A348
MQESKGVPEELASRGSTEEAAIKRLGEYLAARRALVSPEEVGLASDVSRRVQGLRREEVAALASISPEYYRRLERGVGTQPSDAVLDSLATALRLTEHARRHMYRLAHKRGESWPSYPVVDLHTRRMLESWSDTIAFALDRNQDLIAATEIAVAALGDAAKVGTNRLIDVAQAALVAPQELQPLYYERMAQTAAALRYYGDPDDSRYRDIIATLAGDAEFDRIWARHDAEPFAVEPGRVWLDGEGWAEFDYEILEVPRAPGQVIISFWFPPGSSQEAFRRFTDRLAREKHELHTGSTVVEASPVLSQLA